MRILVTAGPTREYLDSVRFISNASSGRMGFGIAEKAAAHGHEVVLIAGPVELSPPVNGGVRLVQVTSAQEMFEAAVEAFDDCDAAVMTAAVCDYRPATLHPVKLKKSGAPLTLHLEPTPDILAHLGTIKNHRVLVGFAMEDQDPHRHAEDKLQRKRCDAIVLNQVTAAGAATSTIEILRAGGTWSSPITGCKLDLATAVVDLVETLAHAG